MLLNIERKHHQHKRLNVPRQFNQKMTRDKSILSVALLLVLPLAFALGCAVETPSAPPRSSQDAARSPNIKPLDPSQTARLQRIMIPLLRAGDRTRSLKEIRVGVIEDPTINAANAGGGEFYVTTGLLQKANDQQLLAVLAHEVAHDDLGHVAKAQALGAGVSIGAIILDQIFPGTGQLAPVAVTLITRSYSRKEEYAADKHGVDLLNRIGQPKEVMIDTLTWLMQSEGASGGGFFATHPATGDRIEALRKL